MRTTALTFLPPVPPGIKDPETQRYLNELSRALQAALLDIYTDLASGASTLTTFAAAPTAVEVPENQPVLRVDAGNEKIYVNVDGTMKSVALA